VEETESLGAEIDRAIHIATSGRPGPVHLSLPSDVLAGSAAEQTSEDITDDGFESSRICVRQILDLLGDADRPLILAGPAMGRGRRWEGVARLSEITGIPALPMESPRGINDPWLHEATNCLSETDLVMLVGKKLDFSLKFGESPFFSQDCRFIQIEADEGQLVESDAVLQIKCDDPSRVIEMLVEDTGDLGGDWQEWHSRVSRLRQAKLDEWTSVTSEAIHPLEICTELQPYLGAVGLMVSDGGEFGQWAQAGMEADIRLINGPSGAIGSGLPMALVAKMLNRSRNVIVFLGDGTFGFHALELETAVRYDIPIVVIVGNDARWNAEHQLQIKKFGSDRTVGCDLLPSRYDRVAEALGGHGEHVVHADDIVPAVDRAIASGLPAVVNVAIQSAGAPTFR
jgi:acetolactate synthase-1/2/3 large subunit